MNRKLIVLKEETKTKLDEIKGIGQTYDGAIQELIRTKLMVA